MKPLRLLPVGALLLALLAPAAVQAHSAVDPVPRGDQWWQDRHAGFNKTVAEVGRKAQVVFIGDSITQGWEGAGKEVWARFYAPRNAINLGIGGDRTQHVLWRLDNGNLEGLAPKAAVVMIGTNNSNGEDNTPEQIVDGVTAIVKRLRDRLPDTRVLLLAIFPRAENFTAQRGKLAMINQALRRLADGEHVQWIDFGHRFLNDDGTMPAAVMPDYLHLSPAGYRIWADELEPFLARVLGDLPAATAPGAAWNGRWVMTLPGPGGDSVDSVLELEADGAVLRGRVARGENNWMKVEEGRLDGNVGTWVVRRDRPSGGTMVYRMRATLADGKLQGTAETELDGNATKVDWSARRP